jgi:uncharacterized integral membrane protein (TIGR00698 family)
LSSISTPADKTATFSRVLIVIGAVACLHPSVSSAMALASGIAIALAVGNPFLATTRKMTQKLMAFSIVGLGAAMDLHVVAKVGFQGFSYTLIGILVAMLSGAFLTRRLKISGDTGLLISVGTSICGGSAIAAVSPAIEAKAEEISVALATVFCLNAVALMIFPPLGHYFGLSEHQFGLWAALGIHDTSSVVGATLQFGSEAVATGTTVKLARALWIVPLVWVILKIRERNKNKLITDASEKPKPKRPWFILGFIVMAAIVTYIPATQDVGGWIAIIARRGMVLALFFIGASLTRETLKKVGIRPLMLGILLWIIVGGGTLSAILAGMIT